jgi:hypothetical protein
MSPTRPRTAAAAAALCLLVPAGAVAQAPPPRSDTGDPPRAASQDLRGEQARAAADLVLGARDTSAAQAPAPAAQAPAVRVVEVPDGGFDLTDAGIGGAAALGLVALAGGGVLLTVRRRHPAGHDVVVGEG